MTWVAALVVALSTISCADDEVPTCSASSDCPDLEICVSTVCQTQSCRTNLDCPADSICFADAGFCGALQCRSNTDCADNRRAPFCVEGQCSSEEPPECTQNSQCGDDEVCLEEECTVLTPGGDCGSSEECLTSQTCDPSLGETGVCVDRCTERADCADDEDTRLLECDDDTGLCVEVACLENEDCEEGAVCTEGSCALERFPCDALQCTNPNRPFRTEPLDDLCRCVQCLTPNHCNQTNNETCSDNNLCLYCEFQAENAAQCPDQAPIFQDGCCLECLNDAACTSLGRGSVCTNGQCIACNCNAGCECPASTDCQSQEDGTGICIAPLGSLGDICTQQADCEDFLACAYDLGECVTLGDGGFCSAGCTNPTRCGVGAFDVPYCYGCHGDEECPDGTDCTVEADWEGVYDGGRCLAP